MKLLALDSSGLTATAAVVTEDSVLAEYTLNYKKTHSQTLLPMIDQMQRLLEIDYRDLDAIAVAKGPGSFTGLRIGSATAKGLAMAWDKPIVPVPTVDALAYQIFGWDGVICPMMDARRQQVYTGLYRNRAAGDAASSGVRYPFEILERQQAVGAGEMADRINAVGEKVMLLGDGVPVNLDTLKERLTVPYVIAPPYGSRQRAAALGALAIEYVKKGITEKAADHRPEYLRMAQAERERMEREGNGRPAQ